MWHLSSFVVKYIKVSSLSILKAFKVPFRDEPRIYVKRAILETRYTIRNNFALGENILVFLSRRSKNSLHCRHYTRHIRPPPGISKENYSSPPLFVKSACWQIPRMKYARQS